MKMPRHKPSRPSTSSDNNVTGDQSETLNLTDEFPDPGLPKANGKERQGKKRVSFDFPVEVITKEAKFTDQSSKPEQCKENVVDLTQDSNDKKQDAQKVKVPPKSQERVKTQETAKTRGVKRPQARGQDITKTQVEEIHSLTKIQEPKIIHDLTNIQKSAKDLETTKDSEPSKNKQQAKKPASAPVLESQDKNKEEPTKKATIKEIREAKRRDEKALRETIKKSIEDEKRAKAQYEEFNKIFKPSECLKHITIEMHPQLSTRWYMRELVAEAAAAGVRVALSDACDPALLTWSRHVPTALGKEGGQLKLTPTKQRCNLAFYIVRAEEAVAWVAAGEARRRLARRELAPGRLTVLIFGVAKVINGMSNDEGNAQMSGDKFGKAFSDLQMQLMVENKIEILMVDTPKELGHLILHYTKSIAEAPYKIAKRDIDEQAEFYMRGDNKNCVTVDKDGNGLSRLWEQMIAVLPMSSLEVARSLGAEYKTPRALFEEFQTPDGVTKIADIRVARTNVPGAKTRRLGPEFARKLHILFTTEDGSTVIE